MPIFSIEVFAKDRDVLISKIELVEKGDNVEIKNEPTFDSLEIHFSFRFKEVEDFVKYKVTIQNNDSVDYKIDHTGSFAASDYILYEYDFEDHSDVIKAGSTKVMYIVVKYNTEVPHDAFSDYKYVESNSVVIHLSNNNSIVNPKTFSNLFLFLFLLFVIGFTIFVIFYIKKMTFIFPVLVFISLVMPISIQAIESIQIKVNADIEIVSNPQFCYFDFDARTSNGLDFNKVQYYSYEEGMTWGEFVDSEYNTSTNFVWMDDFHWYLVPNAFVHCNTVDHFCVGSLEKISNRYSGTHQIIDSSQGCYTEEYE